MIGLCAPVRNEGGALMQNPVAGHRSRQIHARPLKGAACYIDMADE